MSGVLGTNSSPPIVFCHLPPLLLLSTFFTNTNIITTAGFLLHCCHGRGRCSSDFPTQSHPITVQIVQIPCLKTVGKTLMISNCICICVCRLVEVGSLGSWVVLLPAATPYGDVPQTATFSPVPLAGLAEIPWLGEAVVVVIAEFGFCGFTSRAFLPFFFCCLGFLFLLFLFCPALKPHFLMMMMMMMIKKQIQFIIMFMLKLIYIN